MKSAYWGALELSRSASIGSCPDISHERRFWKLLWSLSVTHKIRHFAWRGCRDILPTKYNLLVRKILQDSTCDECGLTAETTGHLFWTCPRAQELWTCSKLVIPFERDQCQSFKDLIWSLLMGDVTRTETAAKVVTGAWNLWNNQNEVRVGGARKEGVVLMKWVVQYLEEYNAAMNLSLSTPTPEAQILSWVAPTTPNFKVIVDGVIFVKQKTAGVGVTIRDDQGWVIATLSKKIPAPLGAVETEAKAFEAGIQFVKDIGIQDFILEGNSLTIYRALAGLTLPPTTVDSLVKGRSPFVESFIRSHMYAVKGIDQLTF